MSFGKNLQHLRRISGNMTQETLAEKLDVSRQTVSKWELDTANPEIEKAIELCGIFNCTLDDLFRREMDARGSRYSDFRTETVPGFRYISHTVISSDPEGDAIDRIFKTAKENGFDSPRVIGWDFPFLSQEQINVYNMHGYTAAWVLPEDAVPAGAEIHEQKAQKYAAVHIGRPFDEPFTTIPGAYQALMEYMRINGLEHREEGVIPCFETDGETMDVYIAVE